MVTLLSLEYKEGVALTQSYPLSSDAVVNRRIRFIHVEVITSAWIEISLVGAG